MPSEVSLFNTTRFTALASGDVIAMVDISDLTQSAHGSVDSITITNFFATVPVPVNITSASATSLAVGRLGATTPAFSVDSSTGSQVAGFKVTGAVTGGTVALVVTDSGADASVTFNAKGTGTIGIGSASTGRVTITPVTTITGSLTLSAALVYGGVTLTNAVTGTGNMVLSAGPTLTGTISAAALTLSGVLTYGGVALSAAVTGTGNMVLSASPTLTGTAGLAGATFSTSIISTTALATPSALSATQFTAFASTAYGAVLMGYGTSFDAALFNRAGTAIVAIGPNSTLTTLVGAVSVGGAVTLSVDGTAAAGTVCKNAANGLELRGATGSSFDYLVSDPAGNGIIGTPTGGQIVRMFTYGAGTATFSANGTISSVSDERLKTKVAGVVPGLDAIAKLEPLGFRWNDGRPDDPNVYYGFRAQNVREAFPAAVYESEKGHLSFQDQSLIGMLVNAVKELKEFRDTAVRLHPDLA